MNHLIFHDQELSMMTSMLPSSRHFVQAAWVVPDLEVAIMHWDRTAGGGPFFTIQRPKGDGAVYRGIPAQQPNCVAALARAGAQIGRASSRESVRPYRYISGVEEH